jgi:hypothetical protein
MHTTLFSMPFSSVQVARLVMAVAVTLVIGSMLVPDAGAIKGRHGGRASTSLGERIESQGDLCFVSGGTFTSGPNQFGTNVTTCTGGLNEQKCVNTQKNTFCEPLYTPPPPPSPLDGVNAPADNGVATAAYDGRDHDQDKDDRKRGRRGHGGKDRNR